MSNNIPKTGIPSYVNEYVNDPATNEFGFSRGGQKVSVNIAMAWGCTVRLVMNVGQAAYASTPWIERVMNEFGGGAD